MAICALFTRKAPRIPILEEALFTELSKRIPLLGADSARFWVQTAQIAMTGAEKSATIALGKRQLFISLYNI